MSQHKYIFVVQEAMKNMRQRAINWFLIHGLVEFESRIQRDVINIITITVLRTLLVHP